MTDRRKIARVTLNTLVVAFVAFGIYATWANNRRFARLTRECEARGGVYAWTLDTCFDPKALR